MLIDVRLEDLFEERFISYLIKAISKKKSMCGLDGVYPSEFKEFWHFHGETIKNLILTGRYTPIPAEKIRIPKRNGKMREIQVFCTVDRMLMYGIYLLINRNYDKTFSDSSFGFRYGRSCIDALYHAKRIMNEGYDKVISIDLEKCFDSINHNKLFQILEKDIEDKRLFNLIKTYMTSKVIYIRHTYNNHIGVAQGSPLSPLLTNIYLNEFDQMMDSLGYQFVRYADDITVFVRYEDEKNEMFRLVEDYLKDELKLMINTDKTILENGRLLFLGYEMRQDSRGLYDFYISEKTKSKMYDKMKKNINKPSSTNEEWMDRLGAFNRGWLNYYKYAADDKEIRDYLHEADRFQYAYIEGRGLLRESHNYITMSAWWDLLKRQEMAERSEI